MTAADWWMGAALCYGPYLLAADAFAVTVFVSHDAQRHMYRNTAAEPDVRGLTGELDHS